uniref:Uncharacterized protein n=1 Tax=Arundo donax TaxID=35708 RepID=A0A0A9E3Q4_ARUDO
MAAARRLSELLQEQQEPFLVEAAKARRPWRGHGAGSGGGGCCPAAGATAACRRLLRLCNHGFKRRRTGGVGASGSGVGGLRSALSKVLCSRAMRRVLRWEDLGGGCFSGAGNGGDREFRRLRRSIGDSGECDPRAMEFGSGIDGDDEDERVRWKADTEVDSSRQLSPVSVLELHSDDDDESPVHLRCKLSLAPSAAILIDSIAELQIYHDIATFCYHFSPSCLIIIARFPFSFLSAIVVP